MRSPWMAPTHNWHLLRTISSEMESGAINLKAIGRQFGGLPLEDLAKVVLSQWCEAGLTSNAAIGITRRLPVSIGTSPSLSS